MNLDYSTDSARSSTSRGSAACEHRPGAGDGVTSPRLEKGDGRFYQGVGHSRLPAYPSPLAFSLPFSEGSLRLEPPTR